MRNVMKFSTLVAGLLASTALANAADLIEPPVVELIPEVRTVHTGGWYLRGDLGYSHAKIEDVTFGQFDPITPSYTVSKFSKANLDETWSLQGGIGYQVTDYFRVDATLARYNNLSFDGRSSSSGSFACGLLSADDATVDTCSVSDDTSVSATTLMANAYVDLGNYSGITPYVGAGIGGAHIKWKDVDNDVSCDAAGNCLNGAGEDYNTFHDTKHSGQDGWRFAWVLHAGASYDLTRNMKLDAGYSYTRIEGGDMFNFESGNTLSGTQGEHGDIEIHTVRAGVRWMID